MPTPFPQPIFEAPQTHVRPPITPQVVTNFENATSGMNPNVWVAQYYLMLKYAQLYFLMDDDQIDWDGFIDWIHNGLPVD